jgi:hypothetical protein
MRFGMRAALLAALVAALAGCSRGQGLLGPQYEYEEDLTLGLDGSATMIVNASIPSLIALRGLPLNPDPKTRVDRDRVRQLYTSPYAEVTRVTTWTRRNRRFVGVRLRVPDIRALSRAAPFAWASYDLHPEDGHHVFRETLGPPASAASAARQAGWDGSELIAFRLHLPSRILWHNARTYDDQPNPVQRGNILTWQQRLGDRFSNRPVAYAEDKTPGVMEVRMDSQSILYRTLWLFGLAFAAAVAVLAFLIWLTVRKGRQAEAEGR